MKVRGVKPDALAEYRAGSPEVRDDRPSLKAVAAVGRGSDPSSWKSPADRARKLGGLGARLCFPFATLNKATRGGVPSGKVIGFGGAPGAGKTTLVVQVAVDLAKLGHHVAILAADEDADGLLIRIGQILGFDRAMLEAGDEETKESFALHLADLPNLLLVDSDEEQVTVEEVSAELHERAEGNQTVLIVDSLQTARVFGMEEARDPRARIDMVMATLKREAKQRGHRIYATAELARGAYRSQNVSERTDDLAAFKESGGIEYGLTTALVLRSVPGDGGLVDVTMPKNRLGQKLPFRIELSFARATFKEVDMPVEGAESSVSKMKSRILEVTSKAVIVIDSLNEMARRVGGNKKNVIAATKELVAEKRLLTTNEGVFVIGSSGSRTVPEPVDQV